MALSRKSDRKSLLSSLAKKFQVVSCTSDDSLGSGTDLEHFGGDHTLKPLANLRGGALIFSSKVLSY